MTTTKTLLALATALSSTLALGTVACTTDKIDEAAGGAGSGGGSSVGGAGSEGVTCDPPDGDAEELDATKLYFEFQSTDDDTGLHGLMGTDGWSRLCVYAPDGTQILGVAPQGNLGSLSMADIFFESREPEADEISQEEILAMFPPGDYELRGVSYEGATLTGKAWLTHDIPKPPVITSPQEDDVVDPNDFTVTWEPVTESVAGDPVEVTAYEVIVTNDNDDAEDPHGLAQPVLSVHVLPHVLSLKIPSEFFESGVEYELEVIALEESGNQTITVVFFETE